MLEKKITVANFEGVVLTLPRASQDSLKTTIICQQNNDAVETVGVLTYSTSALYGSTPTVPIIAQTVPVY